MRKLALFIGLVVAGSILFAQEETEAEKEQAQVKIEKFKERLNLTDDQVADLKEMRESLKPELESLRKNETMSRSERMRARADIIEKQETAVAEILNDEQEAELKVIKSEMREKAKERRKRKRERRKG